MINRSAILACALTLSSLGIASAKSYDIDLSAPAKAGANELKPGHYTLKVEGTQAILTSEEGSKSFTVPVKIEQGDKKFDYTSVESTNEGGMDTIHVIDLGGSKTKLELDQ